MAHTAAGDTVRSSAMSLRDLLRRSGHPDPTDAATAGPRDRIHRYLAATQRDLWLLTVCAMLVDVTLTVHGRQLGLAEANPVARHALEHAGVLGLYGLKTVALGMGACCWWVVPSRYAVVVPLGLAVPSVAAVLVNATLVASVTL
jgi:hypothetical protein